MDVTPVCETRPVTHRTTTAVDVTVPWGHHPSTFRPLQLGSFDPTIRIGPSALIAVHHDSVIEVRWTTIQGETHYRATFEGQPSDPLHVLTRLIGSHVSKPTVPSDHPVVVRAANRHRHLRIAASGLVFIESVKAVLGQRITGHEAALQWARLVRATSAPIPSYEQCGLYELPDPAALAHLSTIDFHRIGVEERRARTIRQLADLAVRGKLSDVTSAEHLATRAAHVAGFGPWSIAVAAGNAFGDTDALPVGDFHLKNTVAWALTNRSRGSDEEMLSLLQPYTGWRWWVTRCLSFDHQAPRFDHRRRNIDFRAM